MTAPTQYRACLQCGGPITGEGLKSAEIRSYARRKNRFCTKRCSCRWNAAHRASTKGWVKTTRGYIALRMPDHPMAGKDGYVMEHRWLMAEALGRLLTADEVVHHRNGKRTDNRLANLELMTVGAHNRLDREPPKPFPCPHCGGLIQSAAYVGRVEAVPSVRG